MIRQPQSESVEEYLSIYDAAEMFNVSTDQLRRFDEMGWVRAVNHPLSSSRLFLKCDLQELIGRLRGAAQA